MEVPVNNVMDVEPVSVPSDHTLQSNGEGVQSESLPVETTLRTNERVQSNGAGKQVEDGDIQRSYRTGYVYDTRMMLHAPTIAREDLEEDDASHPEQPDRIARIYSLLKTSLCIQRMRQIQIRSLEKHEAMLVHSEDHWHKVEAIALMNDDAIRSSEEYYERLSLYVNRQTPEVARLSAGGVVETCLEVARGNLRNAFAIVRPPGHHAEPEEHMGFCFFNNVAVATRVVQQLTLMKKILILDWDVHHGNGTQRAFWTDDSVLYISLHRYENGRFYPTGPFGSLQSCGEGAGLGKSVNIPWPGPKMGDADYLYAFEKVVMPIAYEFAPDLVIISAGFDAADGDTLGECNVTPAGYAHMTHMLASLAGGKLVVALEGGYNLDSISNSALAVTQILLGDAPPQLPPMVASEEATETVWQVAIQQSKYWNCMKPKAVEPRHDSQGHTISIPELLNLYRADYLYKAYKMYQIPFVEEGLAEKFQGQIICTKNVYEGTGTMVVFIHDLCNLRIELDGKAYCNVVQEKSYLEDATKKLVDWVTGSEDFSYIDLNLNARLLPQSRLAAAKPNQYEQDVKDVLRYIWDNYIELSESEHVSFICHGPGSAALMSLLKQRDLKRRVRCILHIVSTGLPPRSPQDEMQMWYRQRTRILVPSKSRVFEAVNVKKRYGIVQAYDAENGSQLFSNAFPDIKAFIAKKTLEEANAMDES